MAAKDDKRATAWYQTFLASTDFKDATVFNGQSTCVTAPHVSFDSFDAFIVEAWVAGWLGDIL